MKNIVKIYSDDVQKRIDEIENQINKNCLELYNEYKVLLDEAYLEGIVEHQTLLNEYYIREQEMNMSLYSELEEIYTTSDACYTVDLNNVYYAKGVH